MIRSADLIAAKFWIQTTESEYTSWTYLQIAPSNSVHNSDRLITQYNNTRNANNCRIVQWRVFLRHPLQHYNTKSKLNNYIPCSINQSLIPQVMFFIERQILLTDPTLISMQMHKIQDFWRVLTVKLDQNDNVHNDYNNIIINNIMIIITNRRCEFCRIFSLYAPNVYCTHHHAHQKALHDLNSKDIFQARIGSCGKRVNEINVTQDHRHVSSVEKGDQQSP